MGLSSNVTTLALPSLVATGNDAMIPVLANLEQLATGLRIADGAHAACDDCNNALRDGASVVVRLRRPADRSHWSVDGVFCEDCGATTVLESRGSALVAARVGVTSDGGAQASWACLADPEPIAALLRRPDVDD